MTMYRMQGLQVQMSGEGVLLQRGKQPRPLEDGNWVCDDPSCGNVNYPRRTEVLLTSLFFDMVINMVIYDL